MTHISIGKWVIEGTNHQELVSLKKEIFGESRYFVDIDKPDPKIIDGGAHVGLAALYFKSLWPQARITCIEPFQQTCNVLRHNLWINKRDDVEVVEAALAEQAGESVFYTDKTRDEWFSTAGFYNGAWNGDQQSMSTRVKTITLKSLLTEPIDLLKLDIEGMEFRVLTAAASELSFVHHLIFEYHPHPQNSWSKLMLALKRCHFTSSEAIPTKPPSWLRLYHFTNTQFGK